MKMTKCSRLSTLQAAARCSSYHEALLAMRLTLWLSTRPQAIQSNSTTIPGQQLNSILTGSECLHIRKIPPSFGAQKKEIS